MVAWGAEKSESFPAPDVTILRSLATYRKGAIEIANSALKSSKLSRSVLGSDVQRLIRWSQR